MYQQKSCPSTDFLERRSRYREISVWDMPTYMYKTSVERGLNEDRTETQMNRSTHSAET